MRTQSRRRPHVSTIAKVLLCFIRKSVKKLFLQQTFHIACLPMSRFTILGSWGLLQYTISSNSKPKELFSNVILFSPKHFLSYWENANYPSLQVKELVLEIKIFPRTISRYVYVRWLTYLSLMIRVKVELKQTIKTKTRSEWFLVQSCKQTVKLYPRKKNNHTLCTLWRLDVLRFPGF